MIKRTLIAISVLGSVVVALYWRYLRPRHLRWGTCANEATLLLEGDNLVLDPKLIATHAVTIAASPEQVWPWLVQIGQGRGGFYSYDWIENAMGLQIENTFRIKPEFQNLDEGDHVPLAPDNAMSLEVARIVAHRTLVLHGDTRLSSTGETPPMKPGDHLAVTWAFYLMERPDGHTRLLERMRMDWNDSLANNLAYRGFLEPGAFLMSRKMLLGIKQRAEGRSSDSLQDSPAVLG